MKFWVLAKGEHFEEQLLVSADGKDELLRQLQDLLHVTVNQMSVTDFQSQVVEKLTQNPSDIIKINLKTSPTSHSALENSHDGSEVSPTSSMKEGASHTSRRSSGATTGGGEMFADIPPIEKICLSRAIIEQLLYPSLRAEYHAVVQGCFVRVRGATALGSTASGYATVQVVSVVSASQLALDLVHVVEVRDIETVSNSPPTHDEVKAWARRMIAAGRHLVTQGFVEAKIGDIHVATRSSKRVEDDRSPAGDTWLAYPPSQDGTGLLDTDDAPSILNRLRRRHTTAAMLPTNFLHDVANTQSNLPSALDPSIRMEISVCDGPFGQKKSPQSVFGRNLLKLNDSLLNGWIVRVEEEDSQCTFVLFGTRHSNAKVKHKRPGDFAACALSMGHSMNGVDVNRDVSVKGHHVTCAPVLWRGCFWCLGFEAAAMIAFDETQSLEKSSSLSIELLGYSGRDLMALYNPPIHVQLPMPTSWGIISYSVQTKAQLVTFRDTLHAFFLVNLTENGLRAIGLAHATTRDARLASWTLVSNEPIAKVTARTPNEVLDVVFHVSVGSSDSLMLLWLVTRESFVQQSAATEPSVANPRSLRMSPRAEQSPEPFQTPRLQRSASAGTAGSTQPRRPSTHLGESPGLAEFVFPQTPSQRSLTLSGWTNFDEELRSGAWTPFEPHVEVLSSNNNIEALGTVRGLSRISATSSLSKSDVLAFVGEDSKHRALLVLSPLTQQ